MIVVFHHHLHSLQGQVFHHLQGQTFQGQALFAICVVIVREVVVHVVIVRDNLGIVQVGIVAIDMADFDEEDKTRSAQLYFMLMLDGRVAAASAGGSRCVFLFCADPRL